MLVYVYWDNIILVDKELMLELAAVITTGGLLLFSSTFPIDLSLFTNIVNLINDSKNLQASLIIDTLKINYLYDAILGLVYVIAWRKEIGLQYPEKLLKAMSIEWKNIYDKIVWKGKLFLIQINSYCRLQIFRSFGIRHFRHGKTTWSKKSKAAGRWLRTSPKEKRKRKLKNSRQQWSNRLKAKASK